MRQLRTVSQGFTGPAHRRRSGIRSYWLIFLLAITSVNSFGQTSDIESYVIDTKGAHAAIQFRIKHLGYSWLVGRFNHFSGEFSFSERSPEASHVAVTIDMNSIDSNHAERDKHLRGEDFFDVDRFPQASFKSTRIERSGEGSGKIFGDLTLKGKTKAVVLEASYIGGGTDPWGGFRRGFQAQTQIALKDFGIDYDLGPAAQVAEVFLYVEGIKQ